MDPVGHLPDVGHVVADQHDGQAVVADPQDEVQDLVGLADTQCGGGLIHDDHPGGPGGHAGHRDGLPLPAGQGLDLLADGLDADAQVGHLSGGPLAHRLLVQLAKDGSAEAAAALLAAQVQVLGDVQCGSHTELLVDGLDAGPAGVQRAVERDLVVVQEQRARVRDDGPRQGLDEGGLAGPVVADDGQDLPWSQVEGAVVHRHDVPVVLGQTARLQDGGAVVVVHRVCLLRTTRSTRTATITRAPVAICWYSESIPAWVRPFCSTTTIRVPMRVP